MDFYPTLISFNRCPIKNFIQVPIAMHFQLFHDLFLKWNSVLCNFWARFKGETILQLFMCLDNINHVHAFGVRMTDLDRVQLKFVAFLLF